MHLLWEGCQTLLREHLSQFMYDEDLALNPRRYVSLRQGSLSLQTPRFSTKVNKRQSEGPWPFIYLDVLKNGIQSAILLITSKVPNSGVE